jgi:hypothetical protein
MKAARTVLPPAGVLGRVASIAIRLWSGPTGRNKPPIAQFISILPPIIALLLLPTWAAAQTPSTPVPVTFFGQNLITPSNYPNVAIGNMGKECCAEWGWIEPNAPVGGVHTYNWATLDSFVSQATISHHDVFMWTMDEAPPWATGNSGCDGGSPNQCTGVITDTVDFQAFITALATRYDGAHGHGLISAYETGNEHDYTGTPAQMAAQINLYVNAIHAANPAALIAGVGQENADTYYLSGNFFDQVFAAWKAINPSATFDALTFHGYPHGCCSSPSSFSPMNPEVVAGTCKGDPQGNGGYADCLRAAIIRNGLPSSTQIWDSEGSWGVNTNFATNTGCSGGGCTTLQVAYVGRSMLLNWSAGVSRQNWYSWDNGAWGTMCTGGPPCTPNAVGVAYAQVYSWMVGSTMTKSCAVESGTVWTCTLNLTNGSQALAVWNSSGSSTYTPPTLYTQYNDLAGNTTPLGATVTIGIQPILLESNAAARPFPPTNLIVVVH